MGDRLSSPRCHQTHTTLSAQYTNATTMPSPPRPQSRHVLPQVPTWDRGQQQMLGGKSGSIKEWESSQLRIPPREIRRQQKVKQHMGCGSEPLEHVPSSHCTKCTLKDESMKIRKIAPSSTGLFGLHWPHTKPAPLWAQKRSMTLGPISLQGRLTGSSLGGPLLGSSQLKEQWKVDSTFAFIRSKHYACFPLKWCSLLWQPRSLRLL